jgi:hypothetical protein
VIVVLSFNLVVGSKFLSHFLQLDLSSQLCSRSDRARANGQGFVFTRRRSPLIFGGGSVVVGLVLPPVHEVSSHRYWSSESA